MAKTNNTTGKAATTTPTPKPTVETDPLADVTPTASAKPPAPATTPVAPAAETKPEETAPATPMAAAEPAKGDEPAADAVAAVQPTAPPAPPAADELEAPAAAPAPAASVAQVVLDGVEEIELPDNHPEGVVAFISEMGSHVVTTNGVTDIDGDVDVQGVPAYDGQTIHVRLIPLSDEDLGHIVKRMRMANNHFFSGGGNIRVWRVKGRKLVGVLGSLK